MRRCQVCSRQIGKDSSLLSFCGWCEKLQNDSLIDLLIELQEKPSTE